MQLLAFFKLLQLHEDRSSSSHHSLLKYTPKAQKNGLGLGFGAGAMKVTPTPKGRLGMPAGCQALPRAHSCWPVGVGSRCNVVTQCAWDASINWCWRWQPS